VLSKLLIYLALGKGLAFYYNLTMKASPITANIEKDSETGYYVGIVPNIPGAHTHAETLDELYTNLKEVMYFTDTPTAAPGRFPITRPGYWPCRRTHSGF